VALGVTIVALLATLGDAVTTERIDPAAVSRAAIAVEDVAVVTGFAAAVRVPEEAVAASCGLASAAGAVGTIVTIVLVAVVASLARIEDIVATHLNDAGAAAAVSAVVVAIIAGLAGVEHPIATAGQPAVPAASVGRRIGVRRPVVALLRGSDIDDPVAARLVGEAIGTTAVPTNIVAVVALLARIDDAVATHLDLAGAATAVSAGRVSVIAHLAGVDHAIATASPLTGPAAGIWSSIGIRRPIVALLPGGEVGDPVAAHLVGETIGTAAVPTCVVAVVALLTLVAKAVSTCLRLAPLRTPITGGRIAVVASLPGVNDEVTAAGRLAVAAAAVRHEVAIGTAASGRQLIGSVAAIALLAHICLPVTAARYGKTYPVYAPECPRG
jgi:hypothetical protein